MIIGILTAKHNIEIYPDFFNKNKYSVIIQNLYAHNNLTKKEAFNIANKIKNNQSYY